MRWTLRNDQPGRARLAAVRRLAACAATLLFASGCGPLVDAAAYPPVSSLHRELAVAVRSPGQGAPDASRCMALARRGGALYLAPGSAMTFFAELPPRGALRFERLVRCGGAARLRVAVTTDEAGELRAEVEPGAGPQAVALPRAGGPARLRLVATGEPAGGLLLGGLALGARRAHAVGPTATPTVKRAGARRPDLLIYLVDALRRDGLGCYGNPRPVSPHLDRLAADGVLFEDAVAQSAWTRTSVASLFTGLDPSSHRVLTNKDALADGAETLAERLRAGGYRTIAIVANGNVGRRLGFHQGFEVMWQRLGGPTHAAGAIGAELLRWLDATAGDPRPYFAYVHVVEPHAPYQPREPFRSRFAPGAPAGLGSRRSLKELELAQGPHPTHLREQLRALYDAEVAAADAAFGALRAGLERRGRWASTAVVVLADHGEEFFEHGRWEHGNALHEESLAIPLLLRDPGLAGGRRVARLARQVDVLPTMLDAAGLQPPAGVEGESLLPAAAGLESGVPPPARSYQRLEDTLESGVTTARFRFVRRLGADGSVVVRLYDRRRDRRELVDVHGELPIATAYLDSVLRWPAPTGPLVVPAGQLDRESREQLRALGYVN